MTNPATGIGHRTCVIGGSCQTATRNTASDAAAKAATCTGVRRPAGSSRRAVRGLRASMPASIRRLSAIARLRAPTIATVIQPSVCGGGYLARGENRPGVGVRQGEDGVLELDERHEAAGVDGGRGQCAVGRSSSSRRPWSSAGEIASNSSAQARGLPGKLTISAEPAIPLRPRESIPCGEAAIDTARMCSSRPAWPVDDPRRGLRGDVARGEPGAAGRQDEVGGGGELPQRLLDLVGLVGDGAPLGDVESRACEAVDEKVAAQILAGAGRDTVGHRQDGRPHRCLTPPVPALPAGLLDEPDVLDRGVRVEPLRHVVDGERGRRDRGQRLHLDAGLRRGLGRGGDGDALLVEHRIDLDHRERERVAQRHDVGRPLRGHDAGEPGGREDVALRERAGRDPLAHVRGERDAATGDSPAPGRRLPAHVDHPDLAHAREVYGVRPGDRP